MSKPIFLFACLKGYRRLLLCPALYLGGALCLLQLAERFAPAQEMPAGAQQERGDVPEVEAARIGVDSSPILALEQITADVREHFEKQELMRTRLLFLQNSLQQTEEDWQRIKREQARQNSLQVAALEASAVFGRIATEMNAEIRSARNDRSNPRRINRQTAQQLNNVVLAKARADLNVLGRSEELRQLDAVSFSVVKRRMDTIQEMIDLHQKWIQWQLEYVSFLERYWPHTDPERKFSEEEIRERVQVLLQTSESDYAAMITCSLLHERLGDLDEAWNWMERAAQGPPFFESTILHLRLYLLSSMKKHREAKAVIAILAKLPSVTSYDRWIKARWLAGEKNWSSAETEWKKLTSEKEFRTSAHRALSLLYLVRNEANSAAREKAVKEATTAIDLDPDPDWFAYFVMANAFAATQRTDEAVECLQKASQMADGDNKALCEELAEAIEAHKFVVWDANRRVTPAP